MRTTHTFSIDFFKRSCRGKKKKGKAHIYVRIWVDGEPAEISLKEEISENDWDPQAEQVKGRSIQAKSLNDHIDDVRSKIKEKYRALCDKKLLPVSHRKPETQINDRPYLIVEGMYFDDAFISRGVYNKYARLSM